MTRAALLTLAAVLLATAALSHTTALPGPLAPLAWLAVFWLPGFLIVPLRGESDSRTWFPLVAGPVVLGAGFCLGRWAGLPVAWAALLPVFAGGLAAIVRALRAAPKPEAPGGGWIAPLAVGVGIVALGFWPTVVQDAMRYQGDARLHIPVLERIFAGSFPPENPFLAGEPLAYFWFYHAVGAAAKTLVPVSSSWLLALFNLHALVVLLLAVDYTARRLGFSSLARAAAVALVALGLSPIGWIRLLVTEAAQPQLNWALIRASGASGMFPLLCPEDPRLVSALTKISISNALPFSLSLATLALALPQRARADFVFRAVLVTGTVSFHLVTGGLLIGALLFREALEFFLPRSTVRESGPRLAAAALTAILAGAVAFPYARAVVENRAGSGAFELTFDPARAGGLQLALIALWGFTTVVAARWIRDPHRLGHLAPLLPAALVTLLLDVVDGNEYKAVFFSLPILAVPAAAGLERLAGGRAWIVALVLILFVPTPYLAARAYSEEVPPGFLSRDRRIALETAAEDLPDDAVVWAPDPGQGYSAFTAHLGATSYLSDPYALQIMGQWNSLTARKRAGELDGARRGDFAAALVIATRTVAPRPILVQLTTADRSRFSRLEEVLRQLGSKPELVVDGLTLHRLPRLVPAPPPER